MKEKQLIENVINKSCHKSFAIIMNDNFDKIRLFISRMVFNAHDADDIVQETFVIAYQKLSTFNQNSQLSTWLHRIAYNKTCEYIRKDKKKGSQIDIDTITEMSTNITGETLINSREQYKEITDIVLSLPEKLRAVIIMITIENKEVDEVAEILECPKATVYWRLHKARKKLKKMLFEKNKTNDVNNIKDLNYSLN